MTEHGTAVTAAVVVLGVKVVVAAEMVEVVETPIELEKRK